MRYIPDFWVMAYEHSPIWSRNLFGSAYGFLKKTKEYNNLSDVILRELLESQWWDKDQLYHLQCTRLMKIITHASQTVPYYRRIFNEYGLSASSIQTPEDLKKMPSLSKETFRKYYNDFISEKINFKTARREATSGTTGTPLTFYLDNTTYLYSRAVIKMHHIWAGYTGKQWIGILSGYKIIPFNKNNPPFWIKNYVGNQMHFSTYHLSTKNIKSYYKALEESKIEFLLGYPSSIGMFAKLINEHIGKQIQLKGVFLGSEPIYGWQRENITKAFQCKVFNYYGQAESLCMAPGCGNTDNLHLCLESGITELEAINENESKIIGTTLINYCMPLIKYELNDVTGGGVKGDCPCGRKHPQIKPIETKLEDFIITPDGNFISASILTFPFKTPKGILESQIIQVDKNTLVVKIVTNSRFSNMEREKLMHDIELCVGNKMRIVFEQVDYIARTQNGKFRFVISEILNN